MNFQAVSGAKLPKAGPGYDAGLVGGYLDANGKPAGGAATPACVDGALGEIVAALKSKALLDKTLIVLTAKHGQSPIDPSTFQAVDDDPYRRPVTPSTSPTMRA